MKILLTGATGFLGSNLLRYFISASDYDVCIVKRSFSNINKIIDELCNKRVTYFDLDKVSLETVFEKNEFDTIVHTATEYGKSDNSMYKVVESNLLFPVNLVELAIKYGVKNFVNTDSFFTKGTRNYSNSLNYSISKKQFLVWLRHVSKQIQVTNICLEHMYGPFDSSSKFVEMLFQEIAVKKVNKLKLTHGHQKRDFVFINDVVAAYLIIIKHGFENNFSFKNYEIGTGVGVEVRHLALLIKEISQSHTILGFGDIEYRPDEIMYSAAKVSTMADLGWTPKVSLKAGIKTILNSYQRSGIL